MLRPFIYTERSVLSVEQRALVKLKMVA